MRRRVTYAPYLGTVIGVLLGLLVEVKTEKLALAILAAIASGVIVGVIWWNIEKLIYKGTDAAVDAARNAINRRKEERDPHTPQKLSSLYGDSQSVRQTTASPQVQYKASTPTPSQTQYRADSAPTSRQVQWRTNPTPTQPAAAQEPKKVDTNTARSLLGKPEESSYRSGYADAPKRETASNPSTPAPEVPLGGFLKAIVIIYYIAAVAMLVSGVITLIGIFSLAALLSRWGASVGWLWFAAILLMVAYPVTAWASFQLARRISRRDPSFLWFFHRMGLVAVPLEVVVLIICLTNSYMRSSAGNIAFAIIEGLVGAILLTVYFVRSARVHAYMGSDDYLYESPFTRRFANFDTAPQSGFYNEPKSGYRSEPQKQSGSYGGSEGERQIQWRTNPAPAQPKPEQTAYTANYPTHRCCVCGRPLDGRYAVLFRSEDGSEARADRTCYEALRDLGMSEDPETVLRAKRYVFGIWMPNRKPELEAYLNRYDASAAAFLRQNKTEG